MKQKRVFMVTILSMLLTVLFGLHGSASAETVTPKNLLSPQEFEGYVVGPECTKEEVIPAGVERAVSANSFTIAESGWVFVQCSGSVDRVAKAIFYSDEALTTKVDEAVYCNVSDENSFAVFLKAGTYYYNIINNPTASDVSLKTYIGFMPASQRISVSKVTYSKDKSVATISFRINKSYFPDFSSGVIRFVKKDIDASTSKIYNLKSWNASSTTNRLDNNKLKVKSNGTYSFHIFSEKDEYFCMTKVNIKGIKNSKLSTPKVSSYKKNTKKIKGKTAAYVKVYVKVGKKTYKVTANSKGKWTVKSKTVLKKGQKIKVYVQNSAGKKSKTKTVKVK